MRQCDNVVERTPIGGCKISGCLCVLERGRGVETLMNQVYQDGLGNQCEVFQKKLST